MRQYVRSLKSTPGTKLGSLTIVRELPKKNGKRLLLLRCDCGQECESLVTNFYRGKRSCGCRRSSAGDHVGERFGKLVVEDVVRERGKKTKVIAKCDCGKRVKDFITHIRMGYRKTCGNCFDTEKDRFLSRVEHGPGQCWTWSAGRYTTGYGCFKDNDGNQTTAHRRSYELFKGAIPDGAHIDHLCRNRSCVNPEHLQPVTVRENLLRSPVTMATLNARKTHCKYGHELAGDNLRVRPDGSRSCVACFKEKRYPSLNRSRAKPRPLRRPAAPR